jgi:hypothetical protein
LSVISEGNKVAMLLKLTFLEGQKRKQMFKINPPKLVGVYSKRISCYRNGDFSIKTSSAIAYCWYIWEKGYKGDTIVKWI